MRTMSRLAMSLVAAAVLLHAGRAWAPFHVVVIDQVFLGSEACPNAQYVMLRMTAAGMVFVQNQSVRAQNGDGSSAGNFGVFSSRLSNGASNATFVMGTADAAGLFGIAMDETTTGGLVVDNGRVCFGLFGGQPVDCVAYGAFTGDNAPRGQPAASPPLGMALVRQSSTNNNANDFAVGAPAPRNNAGQTGTLGQCPGGEPTPTVTELPTEAPTDAATATATVAGEVTPTTPPLSSCVGDCNHDNRVLVNELITGVGIALDKQPLSACPSFDINSSDAVEVNELITAVRAALGGCPATPVMTVTEGPQPSPSATPTTVQQGALGVRRFTVDPEVSRFVGVRSDGAQSLATGWQGFLELRAGAPDPRTGVALIDVTDASDYLAIYASNLSKAICIRVLRDRLPVEHAGLVACNGGASYGVRLTQDHALGIVGRCVDSGDACGNDDDCGGAQCFTQARCDDAGGSVEGAAAPHPGVCNGPFVGALDTPTSPPGTVFIASDPDSHIINGLPVEIGEEQSLPCGDEGVTGQPVALTLTSDHSIGVVLNADDQPGVTITSTATGEPFSCAAWTQEDGPGVLVLSAPALDTRVSPTERADIVAQYVLDD